MVDRNLTTIILAAGQGTRMKSDLPKVMHAVAGRSMLGHVMAVSTNLGASASAVVIGPQMSDVATAVHSLDKSAKIFVQEQRLGTAHAVLAARSCLEQASGDVIVLYGDTPLLGTATLNRLRETLAAGADVAVLGFRSDTPTGYGRLVTDENGALIAIVEEKDASAQQRTINFCNSGVVGFRSDHMLSILDAIGCDNANNEFYLTDAVDLAVKAGLTAAAVDCPENEVLGINSRAQLASAEQLIQQKLRAAAMERGVTMIAPDTVYLAHDTRLGSDVVIEPHVFFGPGVSIEDNVTIKAFSHIEQSHISQGAIIGPYARLRPGAHIGQEAKVGNFVEIKNAMVERGAKVNHLSYIGDARIGEGANIGAGTITCNYDGFSKNQTDIGKDAFIGSNSSLIAPIKIGDGAYVGSGSTLSKDVESDALAVNRAKRDDLPGWAARTRARRKK